MVDRREKIARLAQSKEDEVLLARVYERITLAAQRNVPANTCFLSKREQMLCQELLRGEDFRFFGGTELSEREVCCYLPEYLDESWLYSQDGPIAAVRASFFENDKLTHRDFLVLREILPYVLQNLVSAGRTKLHLEEIELSGLHVPQQSVKTVRDTVPSLRLDGIVSSGFSISRGKAADYIAAGKAELNYLPCMKGDKQVQAGDVISVRGLGKIKLETIGGNTKKGRISIEISRFL